MLLANPGVEISAVFDPGASALRARHNVYDPDVARVLDAALTDDPSALTEDPALYAVIDTGATGSFTERFPAVGARGVPTAPPLPARLLWASAALPGAPRGLRAAPRSLPLALPPPPRPKGAGEKRAGLSDGRPPLWRVTAPRRSRAAGFETTVQSRPAAAPRRRHPREEHSL